MTFRTWWHTVAMNSRWARRTMLILISPIYIVCHIFIGVLNGIEEWRQDWNL